MIQMLITEPEWTHSSVGYNYEHDMETHQVVPDVLDTVPPQLLQVNFGSNRVDLGNELTPTQVKDIPEVKWNADSGSYYTLSFSDPDAPSRENPEFREFQHWLVGNIPGNDVSKGETLSQYISSGPRKGSGLHRYVFVVYKQPGKLTFDEPRLTNRSPENRRSYSVRNFAQKYKLGNPIAGNFYQAQWDEYVPVVHAQMGLK